MSRWFSRIASKPNDFFGVLGDALNYFHDQYLEAQKEMELQRGESIIDKAAKMAGIFEYRYGQLQELEAIHKYVEIQYDKAKGEAKRNFLENYNRSLTDRQADQYADIAANVILLREFIQEVALIRNMYLGLTKGLEMLHYQIGHITRLKSAGLDDATF